jgi:hypothetical protein
LTAVGTSARDVARKLLKRVDRDPTSVVLAVQWIESNDPEEKFSGTLTVIP